MRERLTKHRRDGKKEEQSMKIDYRGRKGIEEKTHMLTAPKTKNTDNTRETDTPTRSEQAG